MQRFIYLCLFNLLFMAYSQAQCFQADASVWKDTWASCTKSENPIGEYGNSHWIQYNFGSVCNLSKTWVWNTNDPSKLSQGFHQVKIDYSEDGQNWSHWGKMEFPKAKGDAVYSGFEGPDLQNVKAQYVMITAISNHGHITCAGLAEVKFNLMPADGGEVIPETEEEDEDEEENESEIDVCGIIEEVDLREFLEIEVEFSEAFVFLEIEEELGEFPLFFEYRKEGEKWQSLAIESEEIMLENLAAGTTYEYRIAIQCGEELMATSIGSFQTMSCAMVTEISIEEITETEAFFLWPNPHNQEFFFVEVGLVEEEEKEVFEVEEAELFLEELEADAEYELRIGTECGEEFVWSDLVQFRTESEDLDLSTSINNKVNLSTKQVHLFPNPTPEKLTVRIKTTAKDVLNFAVLDLNGRTLFRNVTKLHNGTNDLKLDVSNLPDGTYWLHGVTLNQRTNISQQIIKVSRY